MELERRRFLDGTFNRWERDKIDQPFHRDELTTAFNEIIGFMVVFPGLTDPYLGTGSQQAGLRSLTAHLIARYITNGIRLREPNSSNKNRVEIDPQHQMEITMLKELTWHYVIKNPALATQQSGQRRVIKELFQIFREAASSGREELFPVRYREQLMEIAGALDQARIVADLIASLSEQQALDLHQRVTGISPGSVLDSIIR
jgi:dGTPase